MKKILSAVITVVMICTMCTANTFAAESWREAFVTRLMKIMSSDPSYNEVVLTDLDRNGIPEAFVMRDGLDGGISAGFTMNGNTISNIEVPGNSAVKAGNSFPLEVGEVVTIKATYSPFSASVDFGVIAPDGLFYGLNTTTGSFDKAIKVSQRGHYYFAIRNNSSETISVSGYVNY